MLIQRHLIYQSTTYLDWKMFSFCLKQKMPTSLCNETDKTQKQPSGSNLDGQSQAPRGRGVALAMNTPMIENQVWHTIEFCNNVSARVQHKHVN